MNSVKCNAPKFNFSSYSRQVVHMSVQSMSDLLSFKVINIHNTSHKQSYLYVYCLNASTQQTCFKHCHACALLCMTRPMHQMRAATNVLCNLANACHFPLYYTSTSHSLHR